MLNDEMKYTNMQLEITNQPYIWLRVTHSFLRACVQAAQAKSKQLTRERGKERERESEIQYYFCPLKVRGWVGVLIIPREDPPPSSSRHPQLHTLHTPARRQCRRHGNRHRRWTMLLLMSHT